MSHPPHDGGEMAAVAARRAKAIALKVAGLTYEEIANQMGYPGGRGQVATDIKRARDKSMRQIEEGLEDLRELQLQRYDRMHAAHWAKALAGNEASAKVIMFVWKAQCDLLGLNAPKNINVLMEQRVNLEAAAVVEAILAGFAAVDLPPEVRMVALEAAQAKLSAADPIEAEVISDTEDES